MKVNIFFIYSGLIIFLMSGFQMMTSISDHNFEFVFFWAIAAMLNLLAFIINLYIVINKP